ncbi:MAG: right-handed parallel beta-helix repeat-containing protein, partial [Candidatus Kariarchaeaceae archaeon]
MKRRLILIILLVFAILQLNSNNTGNQEINQEVNTASIVLHSAINITGDGWFGAYADIGDGTQGNPWIIEDQVENSAEDVQISISNTDDYFIIRNSTLSNANHGIKLNNVTNGVIYNNTIFNNGENGVTVIDSRNIVFENNTVHGNGCNGGGLMGITLDGHTGGGYHFDPSSKMYILNNTIYNNALDGIIVEDGTDFVIEGNNIT